MLAKLFAFMFAWISRKHEMEARVEAVKQEARADRAEADLAAAQDEKPQDTLARRFGRGPTLKIMALLAFAPMVGCAPAQPVQVDTFCQLAKIITIDPARDRLSDETARSILAHDILVEKRCGKI